MTSLPAWLARWLRRYVPTGAEAIVASAAVAVAALPWRHAYHLSGVLASLVAAAVAPVLIAYGMGVWARQRALVSYAASLVGVLVLLGVVLGPHPSALADGIVRGPSHLLTNTLPLSGPRWVVVVPLVLAWITGAVSGELLIRAHNPGPALAVILASFVVSFAGASAAPGDSLGTGAVLVALLASLALIRQSPWRSPTATTATRDGQPAGRRSAAGGLCAVVLGVALWAVVPSLPGLHNAHNTLTRHPPVSPVLASSPLDAIAGLRDGDPGAAATSMFQVSTDHPSSGYVALAAFDTYDGDRWTFNRTYLPTGGRIPAAPAGQPAALGPVLHQRYTITRSFPAALPFVPFVEHPVSVSGLAADADAASGTIVPVAGGKVGESYSVVSRAPIETLSELPKDAQIGAGGGAAGIELPAVVSSDLAPTLSYLTTLTHQEPTPTVAFLQSLVATLDSEDKRLLPTQTQGSGTSLAEVVSAVTVNHAATPEQFATLFATVARSLGVPARVVTGFRLIPTKGTTLPAGRVSATNRQAWTWVEIPVAGLGWVVVDPTPTATTTVPIPPAQAQASPTTSTTAPAQNALPPSPGVTRAVAPPVNIPLHRRHGLSSWWIVLCAIAGVVAAVGVTFGAVASWRAVRRARRRRAEGAASAAGAWMDVLDAMTRAGADPGSATTTQEVIDLVGRSFGPDLMEPVRTVATLADRALFCARSVPDAAATSAGWAAAVEFGQDLRPRLAKGQRLRGALRVGGPADRR